MVRNKEYSRDEIQATLEKAIQKLQGQDSDFLDPEFDINERTVTHRLGIYLSELFPNEDVDCEYNRIYNPQTGEYIAKRVDLPQIENGLTLEDTEAKTVYPDIIVHKRKTDFNLLAIEIKMGWKNTKGKFDEVKAEAYKRNLGYEFSAYVELGPGSKSNIKLIE